MLYAESAAEAFAILENPHNKQTIDLILLDIMMPEVDGIQACAKIKKMPTFQDIPIIMVTAISESQSLESAFDAGAIDYITKPVNPTILKARVNSALTLKKEMDRRKAREQDIIDIGAKIQQTLLMGQIPESFPGIEIAAFTRPSQKIDGDFYDFFGYQNECLDIFLGDVMGKGVPAALVGAATKANFYRAITQIIAGCQIERLPRVEQIVQYVHQVMTHELIELEKFVTLCYIRYHTSDNSIDLVDCGHTQSIHYQAKANECRFIKGDNTPLGFIQDEIYEQTKFYLDPGDILFLYSDGFTEACSPDGHFFGENRLIECIKQYANHNPSKLIEYIQQKVIEFTKSDHLGDDLTCVVLKRMPSISQLSINKNHFEQQKTGDTLTIKSSFQELQNVRQFIKNYCHSIQLGTDAKEFIWQLETAIIELISNVIKYAYQNKENYDITIQVKRDNKQVALLVNHWGKPFSDPPCSPGPPEEDYPEGGYGLFIIDNYVDQCTYQENENGMNSIVMVKEIDVL